MTRLLHRDLPKRKNNFPRRVFLQLILLDVNERRESEAKKITFIDCVYMDNLNPTTWWLWLRDCYFNWVPLEGFSGLRFFFYTTPLPESIYFDMTLLMLSQKLHDLPTQRYIYFDNHTTPSGMIVCILSVFCILTINKNREARSQKYSRI